MVMAVVDDRVTVMAITTKGEDVPANALPIPVDVARAMGLRDDARSSLLPNELNRFHWVGHDLRARGRDGSFHFGRCPPGFFKTALVAIGPHAVPTPRG